MKLTIKRHPVLILILLLVISYSIASESIELCKQFIVYPADENKVAIADYQLLKLKEWQQQTGIELEFVRMLMDKAWIIKLTMPTVAGATDIEATISKDTDIITIECDAIMRIAV